jgi:hypothetical protein
MEVFFQHAVTKLYLKSPEVWVTDASEALRFRGSLRAIDFVWNTNSQNFYPVAI